MLRSRFFLSRHFAARHFVVGGDGSPAEPEVIGQWQEKVLVVGRMMGR